MKTRLSKQQKESLDNKIVFVSVAIFLYAMLLIFVQKMATDPLTINGALAFIDILRWAALVGAMGCAAWSAYKEKKSFFIYCAMCLFIFLSTTVLKFCTQKGSASAYLIVYAALIALFVLVQVFYAFRVRGLFAKKSVKVIFIVVCALAAAGLTAVSIVNINAVFLPDFLKVIQVKIFG